LIARIGWSDGTLDSGDTKQIIDDWFEDWPRTPPIDHNRASASIADAQHRSSAADTAATMPLDPTKLDVYQRALDLLEHVDQIYDSMPPGRAHLKDQLDRAATSSVLNIAEGAGEFSKDEKQRFYRMARRSATETAAILDILDRRKAGDLAAIESARELLIRVVSMLARLAGA